MAKANASIEYLDFDEIFLSKSECFDEYNRIDRSHLSRFTMSWKWVCWKLKFWSFMKSLFEKKLLELLIKIHQNRFFFISFWCICSGLYIVNFILAWIMLIIHLGRLREIRLSTTGKVNVKFTLSERSWKQSLFLNILGNYMRNLVPLIKEMVRKLYSRKIIWNGVYMVSISDQINHFLDLSNKNFTYSSIQFF